MLPHLSQNPGEGGDATLLKNYETAKALGREYCVLVTGEVVERSNKNKNRPTGMWACIRFRVLPELRNILRSSYHAATARSLFTTSTSHHLPPLPPPRTTLHLSSHYPFPFDRRH